MARTKVTARKSRGGHGSDVVTAAQQRNFDRDLKIALKASLEHLPAIKGVVVVIEYE